jgi:uncharacterized protein (TIGR03086 family)
MTSTRTAVAAPTIPDLRPLLDRALNQTGRVVAGVAAEQAGLPTPCTDYDVAALIGHILGVVQRITLLGEGADALAVPAMRSDVAPADWSAAYRQGVDRLRAVWADHSVLDRVMRLPWGIFPGRVALTGYATEMTMHGWDLAHATGQTGRLDPGLAVAVLDLAPLVVPAESRGGHIPFAPVVEVPADADPYLRVAGYLGRAVPTG